MSFIFSKYNTVSLEALKRVGKRRARQALEKMGGASDFMVDYCMLTALDGHAIPLTKKMIEYLRRNQLVHPDSDERQIEGFLGRQISSAKGYEFYALLRHKSESSRIKKRAKKKAVRKAKSKTTARERKRKK